MQNLSPAKIAKLTTALEQRLAEILKQIELATPAASTVTLDQSKVGRLSRMDAMQQQHMADSTLQHSKQRLQLVQKALNKIRNNEDYGCCELCDEAIAFTRLQVSPEARLCLKCQSQQEQ